MSGRHVDHRPTKEIFYAPVASTDWTQISNGQYGARINADIEFAHIPVFVPHDFGKLEDLKLVVVPNVGLPSMLIRVIATYGRKNELVNHQSRQIDFSFSSATNRIQEVDIALAVAGPGVTSLQAGNYLGLYVSREAAQVPASNADLWVLGVRLKYQVK